MSILVFRDLDGDPVAVESTAIVAIRAGRVERDADVLTDVTLISLPSCTVAVAEPVLKVIADWSDSRQQTEGRTAHPETRGWEFHDVVKGSTQ